MRLSEKKFKKLMKRLGVKPVGEGHHKTILHSTTFCLRRNDEDWSIMRIIEAMVQLVDEIPKSEKEGK